MAASIIQYCIGWRHTRSRSPYRSNIRIMRGWALLWPPIDNDRIPYTLLATAIGTAMAMGLGLRR
jgi:hypothetical protein